MTSTRGEGGKQVESLQSLDLDNQEIQLYQWQTKSMEYIFPKNQLNEEGMNERKNLFGMEKNSNQEDLLYKTCCTKTIAYFTFENVGLSNLLE